MLIDGQSRSSVATGKLRRLRAIRGDASDRGGTLICQPRISAAVDSNRYGKVELAVTVASGTRNRDPGIGQQTGGGVAIIGDPDFSRPVRCSCDRKVHSALGKTRCSREDLAAGI